MAGRGNKVNLDYFELDCHMDEKVRMVQAEYGLKGFAVFVKLLQEIYGENGYYCEWTQDRELLFMSENGLDNGSLQLIKDIVSACIRRNIFSERLFKEYGILTSSGVQKQYLKATVKREVIELKKEYLLITVPKNRTNVAINSISDGRNSISDVRNRQSIVEKSREEESKEKEIARVERFNEFWAAFPNKQRRYLAETAYGDLVSSGSVSEDQLVLAAANYAAHIRDSGDKMFLPNNFLEKYIFEDYLEGNESKSPKIKAQDPNPEPEEELIGEDEEWWRYGPNGWEE